MIVGLCSTAEEIVKQNNALDIYEEYWADIGDANAIDLDTEAVSMSTIARLKPPTGTTRCYAAHNISWHPDGSHKVIGPTYPPYVLHIPACIV